MERDRSSGDRHRTADEPIGLGACAGAFFLAGIYSFTPVVSYYMSLGTESTPVKAAATAPETPGKSVTDAHPKPSTDTVSKTQ